MSEKKKIVFLTGAGVSAESGIKTFRDANGLWEGHDIYEVASPQGFESNPELVLDFYNQRRRQLREVQPNEGHKIIAKLEESYEVIVITQNVDDLHERAGSSNVLHLHGELRKVRSTEEESIVLERFDDVNLGDFCPMGSQLRPHIVWFGEEVPLMDEAMDITQEADVFVVVGTSLEVYPAASLLHFVPKESPVFIIDPNRHSDLNQGRINVISKGGSEGMKDLTEILTSSSL